MITSKWDERFMMMAEMVASWSKDPARKVGAVIVTFERVVLGVGYNGFPRHVRDTAERLENETMKLRLVVHAETNAILNSNTTQLEATTMYCTSYPCSECAKLIAQKGIGSIVCPPPKATGKWAEDAVFSRLILSEASVNVVDSWGQ